MNCGAGKNLLVKGYKAMKIAKNRDIFIVRGFVNISKAIERSPKIIKKIQASIIESEPTTNGLLEVLAIYLSILKSLISLITQPHDLTRTEPIITII